MPAIVSLRKLSVNYNVSLIFGSKGSALYSKIVPELFSQIP